MERKRKDTLAEPSLPGVLFLRKLVMVTAIPLQNGVTLLLSNAFSWGFEPVPGDSLRTNVRVIIITVKVSITPAITAHTAKVCQRPEVAARSEASKSMKNRSSRISLVWGVCHSTAPPINAWHPPSSPGVARAASGAVCTLTHQRVTQHCFLANY